MKYAHIITPNKIIAYIGGKQYSCENNSIRYKRVLSAINKGDNEAFASAMTENESQSLVKELGSDDFVVTNGVVSLDGVEVIGSLQNKLARFINEGISVSHFVPFLRNLRQNVSQSAVKELYDFLGYAELPITPDGLLMAYKGVKNDYWSCTAGKTKLKKGKVDSNGYIFNGIGEEIECDRVEVDDDRRQGCSNGLHVGSHDFATGFGTRTVLVLVNPKDVVSVPLDCECQKMRVCAYKVVGDYESEIKDAMVDSSGNGLESAKQILARALDEKVSSLKKKGGPITLKRVQSSLSPECEPLHTIRDILSNDLGYRVCVDPNNPTSVGSMFVE